MLDQLLSSGVDPLRAADVEELLGLPSAEHIVKLAAAMLDADAPAGLAILSEFELRGRDPHVVADHLTDLVRRALHAALAAGGSVPADASRLPAGLTLGGEPGAPLPLAGRDRADLLRLAHALRRLESGRGDADLRLGLELLLLGTLTPTAQTPTVPVVAPVASTPAPVASAAAAAPAMKPTRTPRVATPSTSTPLAAPASDEWTRMLAAADPATKPLIADARPAFASGVLTLLYSVSKSFMRQRAEGRRDRIEAIAAQVYGAGVQVKFLEQDVDTALREVWTDA